MTRGLTEIRCYLDCKENARGGVPLTPGAKENPDFSLHWQQITFPPSLIN